MAPTEAPGQTSRIPSIRGLPPPPRVRSGVPWTPPVRVLRRHSEVDGLGQHLGVKLIRYFNLQAVVSLRKTLKGDPLPGLDGGVTGRVKRRAHRFGRKRLWLRAVEALFHPALLAEKRIGRLEIELLVSRERRIVNLHQHDQFLRLL